MADITDSIAVSMNGDTDSKKSGFSAGKAAALNSMVISMDSSDSQKSAPSHDKDISEALFDSMFG